MSRKSINFCRTVKMEIFGLIENMSGFTCPHCGKQVDIFGTGGGERTAKMTNIELLGKIPFDPKLVKCSDSGVSYLEGYRDSAVTKAFTGIAEKIAERCG